MARKRVYAQMETLSQVCIAIMESHLTKLFFFFFMAKKTTHTNRENSALLSFNFDVKY